MRLDYYCNTFLLATVTTLAGCSTGALPLVPKEIDITPTFNDVTEVDRLRYFYEINMLGVRDQYQLTGKGVRVTIMGEIVDPMHHDINQRIIKQYNAFSIKDKIITGEGNNPYRYDLLEDGHGTHIAGTIAAECDGVGIQGVACGSTIDVYDIGTYDNEKVPTKGWDESSEFTILMHSFSNALNHISKRHSSRITTGSFNLESPLIRYVVPDKKLPIDTLLAPALNNDISSFDDFIKSIAKPINAKEHNYAKKIYDQFQDDPAVLGGSTIYLSQNWDKLTKAIARYQKTDGVYIITESNNIFDDRTSVLNSMPTLSSKVDKNLWISVVMVSPRNYNDIIKKSAEQGLPVQTVAEMVAKNGYTNEINTCGSTAIDYCLVVPSYEVLSTITRRVNDQLPILVIDDRTYQIFSGHSMGAPMVAGALALMEEYNQRENFGYSMKELVIILKKSADRSFIGYEPIKHGQGMLDVNAALKEMKAQS